MNTALRALSRNPELWPRYSKHALNPTHYPALASSGSKISTTTINSRMIHTRLTQHNSGNFFHGARSTRFNTRIGLIGVSSSNIRPRCQPPISAYQLISLRCYSDSRPKPKPKPTPPEELANAWKNLGPHVQKILITVAIITVITLPFMEQVPYTGRWRIMGVPLRMEATLAKGEYESFLSDYRGQVLPPSHPMTQQISIVVSTILEANGLGVLKTPSVAGSNQMKVESQGTGAESDLWDPDAARTDLDFMSSTAEDKSLSSMSPSGALREWRLIVVDDDSMVNAMAGNGNIIVFTGVLQIARDVDGLAAVISHEIAHVVARHVSEKLSRQFAANAFLFILDAAGFGFGLYDMFVEYLYHLPNSRTAELEADKIGIRFASQACFDPRGAVEMQTRLMNLEKSGGKGKFMLNFLQTHPSSDSRIKLLTNALPEAYSIRAASSACAQLQDDFDAFRTAAEKARLSQGSELAE